MNVLALDTSAAACSVGISIGGKSIVSTSEEMMRGQSERLIPLIQEMLEKASLTPADLDAIATTVGPGAFTGIRIGLASARALGLALEIPVIGFTTTHVVAMAQGNEQKRSILVAIETKRADIYVDLLTPEGVSNKGPQALPLEEAVTMAKGVPILLCGDGSTRLKSLMDEAGIDYIEEDAKNLPDPHVIAHLGFVEITEKGIGCFVDPPQPLYIRPPDVSLPKPNPRAMI